MNFAEAFAELQRMTLGAYCTIQVQATHYDTDSPPRVVWSMYTTRQKWTKNYPTPEEALEDMRQRIADIVPDTIDDIGPTSTVAAE